MLYPSSWLALLLFFVVIAPGLLFDLLSERRRAGLTESAFREVSRVILSSLVFSGFAISVLVAVRVVRPAWIPDPRRLLQHGNYFSDNYGLVSRALAIEVVIALIAACFTHLIISHRQGGASIRQVSAWTQVFKREKPPCHDAYVRVRLNNGTTYYGTVANFTAGPDAEGRELILAEPLYAKPNMADRPSPIPGVYQRVVISGDAIEVLSVEYRLSARSKQRTARMKWRRRSKQGTG
jgi:hypothetical protein